MKQQTARNLFMAARWALSAERALPMSIQHPELQAALEAAIHAAVTEAAEAEKTRQDAPEAGTLSRGRPRFRSSRLRVPCAKFVPPTKKS